MTLRVGGLCSGIGGMELGLEMTGGFSTAWHSEIDPFAKRILAERWPRAIQVGDIANVERECLPDVDLICGGFPCQGHSTAGKRRSSQDERDLWPEFARILGEFEPRWFLAENVRGLLSSEGGRFFGNVLRDLARLGYDAFWQVLPASALGAPHKRERVFLLAYPQQNRRDGERVSEIARARLPELARGYHAEYWAGVPMPSDPQDQPGIPRILDGVPDWVDRIAALGNAVVPQATHLIGTAILEVEREG